MGRKSKNKKSMAVILIVCEGSKTEINYFTGLKNDVRLKTFKIRPQTSENKDCIGIINYTKNYCQRNNISKENGDLIFCVFDRDDNKNIDLENAEKLANKNGFEIIFSNPNIEYWILSHFESLFNNCEKNELEIKLNRHIDYKKNLDDIYEKIKNHTSQAIENCKIVEKNHLNNGIKLISRDSNPQSKVYFLVEKIMKFN